MLRFLWAALIAVLFTNEAYGQQLSAADKAILQAARAKYYNLELKGFMSATCQVHFDFSTTPTLGAKDGESDRRVLEATHFTLHLDSRQQPSMEIAYPAGTSDGAGNAFAPIANLLKSLVTGFFQTWPSKGLDGPIPPFDSEIQSVSTTDHGYRLMLLVPGAPVRLDMDKSFLVTEITSVGGKLDERPVYASSPEGLVFAANVVTDDTEPAGRVNVQYEIESRIVNGLQFPAAVHLRVNENINLKFTLTDCTAVKGKVLEVKAP